MIKMLMMKNKNIMITAVNILVVSSIQLPSQIKLCFETKTFL